MSSFLYRALLHFVFYSRHNQKILCFVPWRKVRETVLVFPPEHSLPIGTVLDRQSLLPVADLNTSINGSARIAWT